MTYFLNGYDSKAVWVIIHSKNNIILKRGKIIK